MCRLPQPLPQPDPVIAPQDTDYPGVITLTVDATDTERRIFNACETIPVERGGPLCLLYPQWLPGYHAPQAQIELVAGFSFTAAGQDLAWRRHPTEVYALFVDVPDGCAEIEARFQFLSPTSTSQGRVVVAPDLLNLEWNMVVLYPAGHFARRIQVRPTLQLPDGWQAGCALELANRTGGTWEFETVPLDILVDSPVFAGRHFRRIDLDEGGTVRLNIVADEPEQLAATEEQIAPHRELVRQADRLFGARHFDHFDVLLALSDQIAGKGVEHHRSCEAVSVPDYFTGWDASFVRRDTIPHEYIHSWNGKYRRGADSWTPSFDQPIRNSLMWVYEGQTQYWDRVLSARSGLWQSDHALQALAHMAATQDVREGSRWRPVSDTTRDPIIAARTALPWPSWQRSEDYYVEGALIWLDVDTRIREATGEERSLDDFARVFFGQDDGDQITSTYTFEDVVGTLNSLAPFDWAAFFDDKLHRTTGVAPLAGIERGGYRLVYQDSPSAYEGGMEAVYGSTNLLFSIGLSLSSDGTINEVLWGSPAFDAALIAGARILGVNGSTYNSGEIKRAVGRTSEGQPLNLLVKAGKRQREVQLAYAGGHRYPHLEPVEGTLRRLDEILRPL